jgi:hypothetical protein
MSWLSKLIGLDRNPGILDPINRSLRGIWLLGGNKLLENAFFKASARAGISRDTARVIWDDLERQVLTL